MPPVDTIGGGDEGGGGENGLAGGGNGLVGVCEDNSQRSSHYRLGMDDVDDGEE